MEQEQCRRRTQCSLSKQQTLFPLHLKSPLSVLSLPLAPHLHCQELLLLFSQLGGWKADRGEMWEGGREGTGESQSWISGDRHKVNCPIIILLWGVERANEWRNAPSRLHPASLVQDHMSEIILYNMNAKLMDFILVCSHLTSSNNVCFEGIKSFHLVQFGLRASRSPSLSVQHTHTKSTRTPIPLYKPYIL